ncbi:hypothetical protein FS749_007191 [Ceratobasidium sp. UAMH 11750]|nr:hypothetical protein FS749_007191 [Ceratobasidium sp. UAMH 11750]
MDIETLSIEAMHPSKDLVFQLKHKQNADTVVATVRCTDTLENTRFRLLVPTKPTTNGDSLLDPALIWQAFAPVFALGRWPNYQRCTVFDADNQEITLAHQNASSEWECALEPGALDVRVIFSSIWLHLHPWQATPDSPLDQATPEEALDYDESGSDPSDESIPGLHDINQDEIRQLKEDLTHFNQSIDNFNRSMRRAIRALDQFSANKA